MDDQQYESFFVNERSEIYQLKKNINKLSQRVGLSENQQAKLDIIIAEITSNFLKHATAPGEVLYRPIRWEGVSLGIEIIGIDHGPGMDNVGHLMEDGISTTRTMGTGIGAIKRLSDEFDIYSSPGWGTLLLSRMLTEKEAPPITRAPLRYVTLMVPYPGEEVCGDGMSYKQRGDRHSFLLTDGLGHGPYAHEASKQAAKAFQHTPSMEPSVIIQHIHEAIASTRGAVGMVLTVDLAQHTLDYCGVGNISMRKISDTLTKQALSTQGILGQNVSKRRMATSFSWDDEAWLVLHSDGIESKWSITDYPGLMYRDLSLWAAALYKDRKRAKDDCAIWAIKLKTTR